MTAVPNDAAMGHSNYARISHDFYPTPEWMTYGLTDIFVDRNPLDSPIRFDSDWWEPACGEGHIVEASKGVMSGKCYATDLIYRGYGKGGCDFLKQDRAPDGVEMIWTNPPYGELAEQFVVKALELMQPVNGSVVMLMRNEYDCSKKRMKIFRNHPAYFGKAVATTRPRWIKDSTGSPRHNYSWYLWDWRSANKEPRIFYFNKQ
ncbi:hypothetical protein RWE87_13805 [Sinorhizobium meliloti]|uniref:hypothetical protein n=1 Tax=Rhizobium meliloti TaxID=382 RepID=UPI00299E521F|nr:hypothetical protein [Sinorhizobium meliloti]